MTPDTNGTNRPFSFRNYYKKKTSEKILMEKSSSEIEDENPIEKPEEKIIDTIKNIKIRLKECHRQKKITGSRITPTT